MATATTTRKAPAADAGAKKTTGTNGKPADQVKGQQTLIATPPAAAEKIKLPGDQYAVVKALAEAGGLEKKVDTSAWDGANKKALSALRKREGVLEIKPADLAKVGRGDSVNAAKLLMPLDAFVASTRAARSTTGGTGTTRRARAERDYGVLSIDAVRRFVSDYDKAITAQSKTVTAEIDATIEREKEAINKAKDDTETLGAGDRLRTALLKKKDLQNEIVARVLDEMNKDVISPLTPVLLAMRPRAVQTGRKKTT